MAIPERSYAVGRLLLIGLIFHLVFILSVFDCYFKSPVVHGMQSFKLSSPQAKRLVLIVGDGLRADLLFQKNGFPDSLFVGTGTEKPDIVAPYLRSIVEHRGAFGVSHTRVPTESRPGHVSIIGGMYEDVSAVTKGWKTNPVDFDSVFNQSSTTFSFGSPDILPMFSRGATPGKVQTWCFNEDDEDFTKDATALDIWVFDRLEELLHNSTTNSQLHSQLHAEGTVFFLHLLGLDTTGHSYRPFSLEYMHNIQVVDTVVRDTEKLLSEFYGDEETSFIFTADHGMSVIGNHGDGHPDNTRTPLIAWGKGLRGPLVDTSPSSHDQYSASWGFNHLFRRDVEQSDIAPLMASLIGINWPVNSVGVLPDVDPHSPGYLNPSPSVDGDSVQAEAALTNALMLLESYRVKHELKRNNTFFYKPFEMLESVGQHGLSRKDEQIQAIRQYIATGKWYEARLLSSGLISTILEGLRYIQTYERRLIGIMVTFAYVGWGAYTSLYVFRPASPSSSHTLYTLLPTCVAGFTLAISWTIFMLQKSPWTYYLYILFPCYFWREFFVQAIPCIPFATVRSQGGVLFLRAVLVIAALQGMVAGYTHRSLWSIGFLLMAFLWPLTSWTKIARDKMGIYRWLWPLSCVTTSIFPLLSVDKTESLRTILSGGMVIMLVAVLYSRFAVSPELPHNARKEFSIVFGIQIVLLGLSMVVTTSSVWNLQGKLGLPLFNQVTGWIVLVASSLIPFVWPLQNLLPEAQLLIFFAGLGPAFVILSISVEGLFYSSFTALLISWIMVEHAIRQTSINLPKAQGSRGLQGDDLRIALFFLFFVQVGFFGTGNVASISSFYLAPVFRLIPIFNPFFMTSLLLFKIIVPYILLSVVFATLNHRLALEPFSLFFVALAVMDGMTLTFFFKVTDTGSWLEIGQTISFFCITSLLLLWSAGICAAGEYLMHSSFQLKKKLA